METVLITGANRGIGLELTKKFLHSGSGVIATRRNPERAKDLIDLSQSGSLTVLKLDVSDGD